MNLALKLRFFKIDLDLNYSYSFDVERLDNINPRNSGSIDLSFHDIAFNSKLEYKIGFVTRAWSKHKASFYSGAANDLYQVTRGWYADFAIPSNATLDFYIIGKIGRATFGLTFENILDRIVYNTGVYPFIDRGGFLNVISRFNITWNFFD